MIVCAQRGKDAARRVKEHIITGPWWEVSSTVAGFSRETFTGRHTWRRLTWAKGKTNKKALLSQMTDPCLLPCWGSS